MLTPNVESYYDTSRSSMPVHQKAKILNWMIMIKQADHGLSIIKRKKVHGLNQFQANNSSAFSKKKLPSSWCANLTFLLEGTCTWDYLIRISKCRNWSPDNGWLVNLYVTILGLLYNSRKTTISSTKYDCWWDLVAEKRCGSWVTIYWRLVSPLYTLLIFGMLSRKVPWTMQYIFLLAWNGSL